MRSSDSPEEDAASAAEVERAEFAQSALENLFDVSPDAIFVTDATGVIRGANPRAAELFGYTQVELFGQPIENLVPARFRGGHPRHRENYNAHPRARQMGAALNLFGLAQGRYRIPGRHHAEADGDGLGTGGAELCARRDRAARGASRLCGAQTCNCARLLESVSDYAIYLLDKDGNVATWNPGAEQIKGYAADEILGSHFSRFFTQEDVERGKPGELMRLAAERGRVEQEGWRVRKDGSRFWADGVLTAIRDATGELIGYAKVTRDFTDRKRAEEAVMLQLSGALLANMDVRKLLEAISASLQDVIPHDAATLGLCDPSTGRLIVQFLGADEGEIRRGDVRLPLDGSPAGEAFRKGRAGGSRPDAGFPVCEGVGAAPDGAGDAVGMLGSADASRRGDWGTDGGEPEGGGVWPGARQRC